MTDTVGPYVLLRLLGKGGMGEVHLARDTRLEREVALKLLPPELQSDPDRRSRFLREARAAAALNHPNITTILDVGEEDGRDYISQEYLEGRPLNEILADRKLPLAELAGLAAPLADALAYAHERGVIHRDLKPANVIVTNRGDPKLLDFGLAKLLQDDADDASKQQQSTTLTISGAIFGTPSAMSPEQALGKPVDARSDVFSFGAMLYEMAACKPAFLGSTAQETMDRVLHSEPEPLQALRRDLPSGFVAVVDKALRKDPAERYQSMAEMSADLRHFKRQTDSGLLPAAQAGQAPASTRRALRTVILIAVVLLCVFALQRFFGIGFGGDGRGSSAATSLHFVNPRQITSSVGWEDSPSWSADGSLLTYHARTGSGETDEFDVWVTQVGSGSPVNRTAGLEGDAMLPSLSPDGTTIAFSLLEDWDATSKTPRGIYTMPVLGGPARVLVPGVWAAGQVQWSLDGRTLAWFVYGPGSRVSIRLATAAGETLREIVTPDDLVALRADLAWSDDERLFAYQVTPDPRSSDTSRLWVLRAEDGAAFPLTDGRTLARSPSFSADGRTLRYVSNQGGTMDLWQQALDEQGAPIGDPVALTAGLGIGRAAFSRDGRRVAYNKGGVIANIWQVPLPERFATQAPEQITWSDARQVTFDQAVIEYGALSPDGSWLAITSDRAGNDDIWIMPSEGGEMRQLTTDPTPDWHAQWSPDGEQILFYAYRSGNRDLWVMPSQGGPARQLTTHPGTDWFGRWSPDGTRIAWAHWDGSRQLMMISPIDPWEPRPEIAASAMISLQNPRIVWADDETLILQSGNNEVSLVDLTGEVLRVYENSGAFNMGQLLPGRRVLVYASAGQLTTLDLDTGVVSVISDFTGRPGRLGAVMGIDGEQLWFGWYEERGDLWVMDVESRP